MTIEQDEPKAARRGNPSYVWRFGQNRRLQLVRDFVPLLDRRILDIGCGIGTYVGKFREFSEEVYGIDVEFDRVVEGSKQVPNLAMARGEDLPFREATFDVVFLHEVLEHVEDDQLTVHEAHRILKPGGHLVIFVPNRLYFFETHGFYLGDRFIFRLLPLVNWFPDAVRDRFVPHARAYRAGGLRRLWKGLSFKEIVHSYVYPGFDNIVARRPRLGKLLREVCYFCEGTPLRVFGLSHFVVLQKAGK